jgi:hypothetical protein
MSLRYLEALKTQEFKYMNPNIASILLEVYNSIMALDNECNYKVAAIGFLRELNLSTEEDSHFIEMIQNAISALMNTESYNLATKLELILSQVIVAHYPGRNRRNVFSDTRPKFSND